MFGHLENCYQRIWLIDVKDIKIIELMTNSDRIGYKNGFLRDLV